MRKELKMIYIIILTLIIGCYLNVDATSNIVYVEGTYQQENARSMLELINNWRKDTANNWYYDSNNNKVYPGEIQPLTYDYGLEAIAMQRAAEISVNFAHKRPNGNQYNTLQVNGYTSVGENIAAGYSAPQQVFNIWQETNENYSGQGHRRNMLSSRNTSIGIGCISVPSSLFRIFCVQEFGRHLNISTTPSEINNSKQTIPVSINTDIFVTKEEVNLDSNEISIFENEKTTLPQANVKLYSNVSSMTNHINTKSTLEWQIISGSEFITLNENEVTAKKKGTAVLKGSIGNSSVTYTINVKEIVQATNISLNENDITLEIGESETLKATITPSDTTNKKVSWKSSNSKIATVDENGKVTAVSIGEVTITATTSNDKKATCKINVVKASQKVLYTTHVQNIGWQDYVKNGEMAGTSGKSLRLEGIKIKLDNQEYTGDIEYRTQVQDIGWQDFVKNDTMSGTSGQSKRLEAIEIKLTGEMANHYDIYYRVHAQDVGWMSWASNGERSGTEGYGRRLEGIEIVLVEKGKNPPKRDNTRTNKKFVRKTVTYRTHVQDYGWQDSVADGVMSGTSHESKRLEGIEINLYKPESGNGIEYRTHVQDYGWQDFVSNGNMSGTSGESKRLEAIEIRLTGPIAKTHDVYYRVHAENFGWMGWAKNGESAGTAHYSYRLEAIEIVVVEKGENPPERTDTKTEESFKDKNKN